MSDRLAYSPDEAAQTTGLSRARILKAIHATDKTRLTGRVVGSRYVILARDLEAWLAALPES